MKLRGLSDKAVKKVAKTIKGGFTEPGFTNWEAEEIWGAIQSDKAFESAMRGLVREVGNDLDQVTEDVRDYFEYNSRLEKLVGEGDSDYFDWDDMEEMGVWQDLAGGILEAFYEYQGSPDQHKDEWSVYRSQNPGVK